MTFKWGKILEQNSKCNNIKGKLDESGHIKITYFYPSKNTSKRVKRQDTWQKVFGTHVTDKGLISDIYKEPLQIQAENGPNT